MEEIVNLQNAASYIGGIIHEKYFQDKRKTGKKYFLTINGNTHSPVLDYDNMNSFLLGWIKAKEYAL